MEWTRSFRKQRALMFGGGIPDVAIETVARIAPVPAAHDPIAQDLGHDAGGGDTEALSIPLDQCQGGGRQILWKSIAVDQDQIDRKLEPPDSAFHSQKGGSQYVPLVDFRGGDRGRAPTNARGNDAIERALARRGAQSLRIVDPFDLRPDGKRDSGDDHRSGQATSAHLVDSGQAARPSAVRDSAIEASESRIQFSALSASFL